MLLLAFTLNMCSNYVLAFWICSAKSLKMHGQKMADGQLLSYQARAWFLRIASVHECLCVCVCVRVCVCVHP